MFLMRKEKCEFANTYYIFWMQYPAAGFHWILCNPYYGLWMHATDVFSDSLQNPLLFYKFQRIESIKILHHLLKLCIVWTCYLLYGYEI